MIDFRAFFLYASSAYWSNPTLLPFRSQEAFMFSHPILTPFLLLACFTLGMVSGASAGDAKELIRQAKAALRAAENTNDPQVKNAKLDEARGLIDRIKEAEPNNPDLRTLESKYRYQDTGREATKAASAAPSVDQVKLQEVLADWNAIITLDKGLHDKTHRYFPHAEGMSYTKEQTDQVLTVINDVLKNDQPKILAYLKTFSQKYGEPNDEMDRKIYALTPKDPMKGMYDEVNQRPSELPSRCYMNLIDRLTWVRESPKQEAKLIMKRALELIANADFYMDTKRDAEFAAAEAELNRAKRFNPQDAEIPEALATVQVSRKKSQADVQKAIESARFPASVANFPGPGRIPDLIPAVKAYFAGAYPKENVLAVSVSGGWVATKHNILGQPIQWGLPVYCVSQQNEPGICRVFKMTVLTGIGIGVAKAPPFTDHWTGDSFRMKAANLK
jgi:hypothetical protein